ncbi:MAG: EAL domain-containing protein [Methylococcales symbiont of Iophon sp. n. MRB-2018]|nr:MAG: EAL domain-containing protein [Methylococcales symbiont of Iophon sp. n. MRB-2018]KAF3980291.1 MAG: EAL domain-containing protein [Methylococcales symbiont of Iophon sp. n. MRB-2018]
MTESIGKQAEERIRYQVNYDALTDLPNRYLYSDRLESAILHAKRIGKHIALMRLDLDRLKWINDTFGHRAGDIVLQETAKRLKRAIRSSDTIARIGGDEFVIILPELERSVDAETIATKIFSVFSKAVDIDGNEVFISASIGVAIFPEDGEDAETLQRNADNAMYSAKEGGRNRFHFYTSSIRVETERRIALITYLRSAIVKNELSLVYQPIVDIVTNETVSAEALLRWKHPRLGFISPVEFIPLAEESGLIKAIGNWVALSVAKDIQRWKAMGLKPISISINKSPAQFSKQLCDKSWNAIFEAHDVPLSDITLEITETIFMEKGEGYIDHLSRLKSLGVQIALDDFGTGYSSLSYLKRFPVDILKIDREFIKDITTNDSDALLVETIIILAEKMHIKVIAEGVETEEQLNILKHHNCRYVQGYYFSKPLTVNKFERYLGQYKE